MKQITSGVLAVVLAIACFAFTTSSSNNIACEGDLVWYEVKVGNGDDINVQENQQLGSTDRAKLELAVYPDATPSSVTLAELQSIDMTTSAAQSNFCPTDGDFKCAVAFIANTADFEHDASGNIIPKTSAQVACVIFREVE